MLHGGTKRLEIDGNSASLDCEPLCPIHKAADRLPFQTLTCYTSSARKITLVQNYGQDISADRNPSRNYSSHGPKLFLAFQQPDQLYLGLVRLPKQPSHPKRSPSLLLSKGAMRPRLDLLELHQLLRRRLYGRDLQ